MAITSLDFLSISPWPDPTRGESPRGVRRMALLARPELTSTTAAGLVAATSTPASFARQAHGQTGRATQLGPQLARLRLKRCHRRPVCIGVDRAVGALLPSWSMTW